MEDPESEGEMMQEPINASVQDDVTDILQQVESGKCGAEVLVRFLQLMQAQWEATQSQLLREEQRRLGEDFKTRVMIALLGPRPMDVMGLLEQVTGALIMQIRGRNGLTVLHHACRLHLPAVSDRALSLNPALAGTVTYPQGRPPHWTALMVVVDQWKDVPAAKDTLRVLVRYMSPDAYSVRATNGATALHTACSRGNSYAVKKCLYGLYNAAGGNEAAFGLVVSLLNSPGGGTRNAGCVDHALRASTELARYIQNHWNAVPQLPPPESRAYAGHRRTQRGSQYY
jgi:hypothetical protein